MIIGPIRAARAVSGAIKGYKSGGVEGAVRGGIGGATRGLVDKALPKLGEKLGNAAMKGINEFKEMKHPDGTPMTMGDHITNAVVDHFTGSANTAQQLGRGLGHLLNGFNNAREHKGDTFDWNNPPAGPVHDDFQGI
jgi:hypothetical protein